MICTKYRIRIVHNLSSFMMVFGVSFYVLLVFVLCLSLLTKWRSLEPVIKGDALSCLLQVIWMFKVSWH